MSKQDYPPPPDLSACGDIWRAILEWEGNKPGYTAMKSADKIDEVLATAFHDYAAAALAQQSVRHAEELAAYELTVERLRAALESMTQTEPCNCGCDRNKVVLLKPAHYYAIAKEALKGSTP